MKFLVKVAFWLTVVLVLLPTGGSKDNNGQNQSQVSATDAVSAASAAVSDARQFCVRQPDACAIGSQVAVSLGQKAQAGAKMLYDFLTDKLGPQSNGQTASSLTGPSQNTLTPADLAPAWRAPAPHKAPEPRA
jgi:hypothetical protein